MKYLDISTMENLSHQRMDARQIFHFRCAPDVSCFNLCCRNLNLFLYPYDVIRLKHRLKMSSARFIDQYTDIIMREGSFFPDVLLKMLETTDKTCPFLTEKGCSVYPDRPDACRTFPLEMGIQYHETSKTYEPVYFFRPPDFCKGADEKQSWTVEKWGLDQEIAAYQHMTIQWAKVKSLFQKDPWGPEGVNGQRGKMAFMAIYNSDDFREFVFNSSFLKRYKVQNDWLNKMKKKDEILLNVAFDWVKLFLWGMPSKKIRLR
ncbi:MAG: YkgJ family cysteine cluster protein [Candidatus Magnetomorum sp.]|nr:YkgJ family cysteine cluster protein [Candidatus Magnetomorum sp.]